MAILSNDYFQQRFGGDRSIVGKPLPVSAAFGPAPMVVGVLAPGFELLFPPEVNIEQFPSVWLAARIPYDVANRNNVQWRAIGRLKPGVSIVQAQAEAETIAQKIREENTIAKTAGQYFRLVPMKQHLVDEVRPTILALMGAVIFLLLIACANVANLMLVRASSRERELAVRAALGAGWWQLVRQTLAEAIVIAALGTTHRSGAGVFRYSPTALDRAGESASPECDRDRLEGVGVFGIGRIVVCGALWRRFRHFALRNQTSWKHYALSGEAVRSAPRACVMLWSSWKLRLRLYS